MKHIRYPTIDEISSISSKRQSKTSKNSTTFDQNPELLEKETREKRMNIFAQDISLNQRKE